MPEYRTQSTGYNCQKINSKVSVTSKFLIHRSSATGEVDKEIQTSFDCNKSKECGVEEISGMSATYNWKKCIHPLNPDN